MCHSSFFYANILVWCLYSKRLLEPLNVCFILEINNEEMSFLKYTCPHSWCVCVFSDNFSQQLFWNLNYKLVRKTPNQSNKSVESWSGMERGGKGRGVVCLGKERGGTDTWAPITAKQKPHIHRGINPKFCIHRASVLKSSFVLKSFFCI